MKLDLLIIAPCTGNTIAKLAHGITDTAVTMAAKAHSRQDRPILIALATNDAMSANLENIGRMMQKKSVYFVPMRQDDPVKKPHSLVAVSGELKNARTPLWRGSRFIRCLSERQITMGTTEGLPVFRQSLAFTYLFASKKSTMRSRLFSALLTRLA